MRALFVYAKEVGGLASVCIRELASFRDSARDVDLVFPTIFVDYLCLRPRAGFHRRNHHCDVVIAVERLFYRRGLPHHFFFVVILIYVL